MNITEQPNREIQDSIMVERTMDLINAVEESKDIPSIKKLLEAGAPVNETAEVGLSSLNSAVINENKAILEF